MKRAIFKWQLNHNYGSWSEHQLDMPADAIVRKFDTQGEVLRLWAEVDPTAIMQPVQFVIVGTGRVFDADGLEYVGTAQQGPYVWHCYRKK